MKVGLNQFVAQASNSPGIRIIPERGYYSFGNVLRQQIASEPHRYDSSASGQTHSFSEMPIVAPSATDSPKAPSPSNKAKVEDKHSEMHEQSLARATDKVSAKLETGSSPAQSATGIEGEGPMMSLRPGSKHAALSFPSTVPAPQNQIMTRAVYTPTVSTSPSTATNGALRHLPLHVRLTQSVGGVSISIATSALTDSEQHELEGRVSELARRYGVAVSELRIGNFGRRS